MAADNAATNIAREAPFLEDYRRRLLDSVFATLIIELYLGIFASNFSNAESISLDVVNGDVGSKRIKYS